MNRIITHEDFAEIILTSYNTYVGRALIDIDDLEKVRNYHWYLNKKGCVATNDLDKYSKELHRHIMDYPEGMIVNHINRDKLDNRKCNLRICTNSEHSHNKSSVKSNSKTGFKGIAPCLYKAKIQKDGVTYQLGKFYTKELAAMAYDRKAIELFGEYARTNFPIENYSHLLELEAPCYHETIYDSFDLDSWNLFDDVDVEPIDYDNII